MQGAKLGPYEILEQLGAGGMGEVWLARDTRLGRQVAVKVLPEEFASDPERLARFEQEARAAAALNHPHIAAVFDVGAEGDTHYMVQEHLQGESLGDLLESGPLGLKRALVLGIEIAEALKAAHRAGIVHRDLKPENVFVTEDGHAKVLDFGLAKLTEVSGGALGSQSMSPTVLGTQAGAIMGTAGYMAPEQVQGEDVDARADVFALGCVLWEMLTGRRAFQGKSVPHTLHKILDEEPEGSDADAAERLPLRLRWLLERTLAKAPDERAQSAADVVAELRRIVAEVDSGTAVTGSGADPASAPIEGASEARGPSLATVVGLAAAALLAGVALAWTLRPAAPAPANGPVRFAIDLPEGINDFSNRNQRVLAISPDGQTVAFVAADRLWMRRLDDLEPVALRGTEEPRSPSFSPDSGQIAFWADDQIKRVGVSGGAPVVVGPSPGRPQGVSWEEDGFIYVGASDGRTIFRLPETGGQPEIVVDVGEEGSANVYGPRLLPGGDWLLFTLAEANDWDRATIVAQSLTTDERRVVVEGGHDARYVSTGHLLYVTGNVLLAVRFDADALTVSGGAVPMVEQIRTSGGGASGAAYYSVAANGNLAYAAGASSNAVLLSWVDRAGNVEALPFEPARFDDDVRLSPDGARLAVEVDEEGSGQIWVYEVDRSGGQRLSTAGTNGDPIWSPDGEWVYFHSSRDGGEGDVWRRRYDLSAPEEPVLEAPGEQHPTSISPDGEWLYYTNRLGGDPSDVFRVSLREPGATEPVVGTPAAEFGGRIGPDGRLLAFVSAETGNLEVFALDLESGRRWRLSTDGGTSPAWSAATRELFYVWTDGLHAVSYEMQPQFTPGVPRLLRASPPGTLNTTITFTPDAERSVVRLLPGVGATDAASPRIDLVVNWLAELLERVPKEG